MASPTLADLATLFLPAVWLKAKSPFEQKYPLQSALLVILLNEAMSHMPSRSSSYCTEPPASCQDFLDMCRTIFSHRFCMSLESRIRGFDAMVQNGDNSLTLPDDCTLLSELFIRDRSR